MKAKPDRRYCGKSAIGLMIRRPTLWGIWLFLTMKMTIRIALNTDAKSTGMINGQFAELTPKSLALRAKSAGKSFSPLIYVG
jgi:hypothetical protein